MFELGRVGGLTYRAAAPAWLNTRDRNCRRFVQVLLRESSLSVIAHRKEVVAASLEGEVVE